MPIRLTFLPSALVASCSLVTALAFTFSGSVNASEPKAEPAQKPAVTQEKGRLPLDDLRAFTEVLQRIKSDYVEPIDDKTLLENAIRGMLDNLDPHSAYLQKEDYQSLEESTSGEFGGLGIEVGGEDGLIKVITPIDGTPAQKAGVKAGDLIIKLDDTPIRGLGLKKSVELMRGKTGEPITLTIIREGASKPLEITVVRDIIKVDSVRHKMLDKGLGYIRISQFQVDTGKEVLDAINSMRKEEQLSGVVLDLRNNPGGVLQAAVDVSDLFLKDGLIVYTKGRIPNSNMSYSATAADPSSGIPLVVLINGGSASASEIVAGALQDHRRAIVIGTKSFGKGSVQTVQGLRSDGERGLKLTTALYYTPSGRSIQAEGIMPDITVADANVTRTKESTGGYREADLKNHLDKNAQMTSESGSEGSNNAEADAALDASDYQLYQALNILKSLHLSRQPGSGQSISLPAKNG
ncbi:S41 family peptidase [Parendozoicomonas haliclonae]|uniref:Putative CtpA-like serine protease n=1 Tax=Parendozoicomonas haliclonae TaxID=1960125 RepID=A0A1X7AGR1_9GAMM|nr:S41 family peptidase [Parendozoicomonas haliclonae]SMA39350.1 putative CtpA-like serine protease [Parendozoicomonas haliclonae]